MLIYKGCTKMYDKFYKKTTDERRAVLKADNRYLKALDYPLPQDIYEQMIENAVTTYEIPMGVALNFLINDKDYIIPMVTEEPSVIAAASNAAKIIRENGGFMAQVLERTMIGQIAFKNPENHEAMMTYIDEKERELANVGHNAYPSIVKRGGGVRSIRYEYKEHSDDAKFFIIYVSVDTQEAMGANIMNTMLEAMASYLQSKFQDEPLMSILSNLSTECLVEATCIIDPKTLKNSDVIAERILSASQLAEVDPYRATTHNKGIMNGIDAVVIATGNDWRAIEACSHAFASQSGSYQPLVRWSVDNDGMIVGHILMPMPIGAVGGSIGIHPKAQLAKEILKYESASELMEILACVGLAQNFAAIYALTTVGIQKGHMALQARSLAIQAGCPMDHLDQVVKQLTMIKPMNLESAKRIIESLTSK